MIGRAVVRDEGDASGNLVAFCEEFWPVLFGADAVGMRLDGSWWWVAYKELQLLVEAFRGGLASLGVGPGDAVAIVSENRLEWIVACYATYGRGARLVALDPARAEADWRHALVESGTRVAIGDSDGVTATLRGIQAQVPRLSHVIGLEPGATSALTYRALLDAGRRRPVRPLEPRPTDVASVVYRFPGAAAAAITHGAMMAEIESMRAKLDLATGDRAVIAVPWSSRRGQAQLHCMLMAGCSVALPDGTSPSPATFGEIAPVVVFGRPELFARLGQVVEGEVSRRPAVLQPFIRRGLRVAAGRLRGAPLGPAERLLVRLAERLLPEPVRMPFGRRLRYAVSSGALPPPAADPMRALAIDVRELAADPDEQ